MECGRQSDGKSKGLEMKSSIHGRISMYKEVKGNFSKEYPTWIIAYCIDTDSFFCTNQRCFWWEYDDEFQCENNAISYFRNHYDKFKKIRKEFAEQCGGISKDGCVFLENTKERWV